MKNIIFVYIIVSFFPAFVISQGKVGINTIAPAAMLHVQDSSVVFTGLNTLPATPGNPPVSGAGTRFMWYPDKSALRAGRVSSTQWNKSSVGLYSTAFGLDCTASGIYSNAFGQSNIASGPNSVAIGYNNNASTSSTVALGTGNTASGNPSLAIGTGTTANSSHSVAIGSFAMAIKNYAMAFGYNALSSNFYSIAIGENTHSAGNRATCLGSNTQSNGYSSTVIGLYNDTIVAPQSAISNTTPLFIIGNGTSSTPSNAMTVLKNGNIGIGTTTPGFPLTFSNTFGDKISLFGQSGTSYGFGIQNNLFQIHTPTVSDDIAFGYGTSTSFTECMRITGDGFVGIANNNPSFKLDVSGRMRIRHSSDGSPGIWFNKSDNSSAVCFLGMYGNEFLGIYGDQGSSWNFVMSTITGRVGIGTLSPSEKLHVNGNGKFEGTVTASCGVLVCSDERYKTNITPLNNSLASILLLQGITYEWQKEKFPDHQFDDKKQIGFSAQELEKVYPEMVHTDEAGYKTVDYSRLTPVLVEAIKEQQAEIEDLKSRLEKMEEMIKAMATSANAQ